MFKCNMCNSRYHNHYKSKINNYVCVWCYISLNILN